MISVTEALEQILSAAVPLPAEQVSIADAQGRVLAEDVTSRRTQPPFAVSAMDGYAVRAADLKKVPTKLTCIGEAPAGGAFEGMVGEGECVPDLHRRTGSRRDRRHPYSGRYRPGRRYRFGQGKRRLGQVRPRGRAGFRRRPGSAAQGPASERPRRGAVRGDERPVGTRLPPSEGACAGDRRRVGHARAIPSARTISSARIRCSAPLSCAIWAATRSIWASPRTTGNRWKPCWPVPKGPTFW